MITDHSIPSAEITQLRLKMSTNRALHFVFKVGDRKTTTRFYKEVLGMKILRHEEFEEGCKAACNGPYDGKWSKSMVGYGREDDHFVVELTYNYGISNYALGNDYLGITIKSQQAIENAKRLKWPMTVKNDLYVIEAPGGYKFFLIDEPESADKDPVQKVCLGCSNLLKSVDYWHKLCGMKIYSQEERKAVLGYANNQCKLELQSVGPINHASAFGRIAFSCASSELPGLEKRMKEAGQKILTPLVSLDTPGKATVQVVILADPDGHEICFVGDEAFRQLSKLDPNGDQLLTKAIEADKSDEWFTKKGRSKATA